jgi:GMP synthase-like glutamine amidotransferase
MKPIIIFRHIACEDSGYLGDYLILRNIPFQTICLDRGGEVPSDPSAYAGFVFMGGPMSVNDAIPWIEKELELIRMAYKQNLPMLGHCLGGQLISKALGGEIRENPVPEIGWHSVRRHDNKLSKEWFEGLPEEFEVFHWHGETFSLPDNAVPLLQSDFCNNQSFIIGNCLALQCHVEMKSHMVQEWLEFYKNDLPERSASVQSRDQILENLEKRIQGSVAVADVIYSRWLAGFKIN